jgi:hypothetical protein
LQTPVRWLKPSPRALSSPATRMCLMSGRVQFIRLACTGHACPNMARCAPLPFLKGGGSVRHATPNDRSLKRTHLILTRLLDLLSSLPPTSSLPPSLPPLDASPPNANACPLTVHHSDYRCQTPSLSHWPANSTLPPMSVPLRRNLTRFLDLCDARLVQKPSI